jgi:DNA-binding NtrC family response regulator
VSETSNGNGNGNGKEHGKTIPIAELEKMTILSAISELHGDKLQAARLLGIGKTTLFRKLKDLCCPRISILNLRAGRTFR